MDEARIMWVRVYRKGREKGGWVYLDEALLQEAGMPTNVPLMVKRYAIAPEARKSLRGVPRPRGRIILNLAIITETTEKEEAGQLLTRHRKTMTLPTSP